MPRSAEITEKAGDRDRTGNIQLGRLTLYQLSYAREDAIIPAGSTPGS